MRNNKVTGFSRKKVIIKLMFNKQSKQDGFVSIIVAALIMIVLSLITIGFTRLMQREQRQALDRQLTRQALYAAESGINDVYNSLQANPALPAEKTTCDVSGNVGGQPNPAVNNGIIDSNGLIAYTCALYDKTPTELVYSLGTNESKIVELKTDSGLPFNQLTFSWGNEQGNNDVSTLPGCGVSAGVFPASRSGQTPLLRIDITDIMTLNRDQLINRTDHLYVAPCSGSSVATNHAYLSTAKGTVLQVPCSSTTALPCTFSISGLNSSAAYLLRIRSIYDSAQVVISALEQTGAGSTETVEFRQAQTSIDVTAKANDIVRRLRVTMPIAGANSPPESVFQSFDGICKLLGVDAVSSPARVIDSCTY